MGDLSWVSNSWWAGLWPKRMGDTLSAPEINTSFSFIEETTVKPHCWLLFTVTIKRTATALRCPGPRVWSPSGVGDCLVLPWESPKKQNPGPGVKERCCQNTGGMPGRRDSRDGLCASGSAGVSSHRELLRAHREGTTGQANWWAGGLVHSSADTPCLLGRNCSLAHLLGACQQPLAFSGLGGGGGREIEAEK